MINSNSANIPYYQYLDHQGHLRLPLEDLSTNTDNLIDFYRVMLLTRTFDLKAINLQRTGKLGTYASSLGQEAIGAALGAAMSEDDVLAPTYRDYAAQLSRGIKVSELLLYWGGDERGMDYQYVRQDLPICVPIASQTCHAVGVAYAMKIRKQKRVAVCIIGDGATSKGDFYEAMNAAGVWQLPLVFIIANNQWAISLPREKQTNTRTLAQKAASAGIPSEQFDGNDVIACYERISIALKQARKGEGACLLEALTYRLSDHTTADDAGRYRPPEALKEQWQYDPIVRLKTYFLEHGLLNEQELNAIDVSCGDIVSQQVDEYLNTAAQTPESMFDYLYENLPESLQTQREEVKQKGLENG
ncbi:MAG: pyruvate dehydrogenase (acetyl-transferring) E1 component subunit alpha [Ectothiorhodospiraceae bacterium]|nr:pyruvate dehydrogenase (acetyl-transferring) E1 component subunit alpha [Ectothiorhodospiraceae bacterium]